jgi:hypothetical protein
MATAAEDVLPTVPDTDVTGATDTSATAVSVIANGLALVTGWTVTLDVARWLVVPSAAGVGARAVSAVVDPVVSPTAAGIGEIDRDALALLITPPPEANVTSELVMSQT